MRKSSMNWSFSMAMLKKPEGIYIYIYIYMYTYVYIYGLIEFECLGLIIVLKKKHAFELVWCNLM